MTVLVQVRRMSTAELKLTLSGDEKTRILIIDCRPFIAYNASHIDSSHNIHFPRILRRRSKGPLPLKHIVTCPETRDELLSGVYSLVVVYDDNSMELTEREGDLQPVLETLVDEPISHLTTEVCFLEGGFDKFSRDFASFCAGTESAMITSSTEKISTRMAPPMLTLPSLPPRPLTCNPTILTHVSTHVSPLSSLSPSVTSPMQACSPISAGPNYERVDPVQILPFLYLGSVYHASRKDILEKHGITAIVNVSASCQNYFPSAYKYKQIAVSDSGEADLLSRFDEASDFIDSVQLCGGRVLIHCYAGISRSATVCLAYLMKSRHMQLEEAFEFVRKLRAVISPNLGFMLQLSNYETELQQKESATAMATPVSRRRIVGPYSFTTSSEGVKKSKMSRELNLPYSHSPSVASRLTRSVSLPVENYGNKVCHGSRHEEPKLIFNFNVPPFQFANSWSSQQISPPPIWSPS